MKNRMTMTVLTVALAASCIGAKAQALPTVAPTTGNVLTNLALASGASAISAFALNLLPGWDKTQTNAFNGSELELEVSPVWKAAAQAGSTPYVSIGGTYWFSSLFGAGADMVTFGNGSGTSALDSAHVDGYLRKSVGNVAGHLMLGAGKDVNANRYDVEAGGGLEYRYTTGVGVLVDTRYLRFVNKMSGGSSDHEFLTRVGLTIHF